MLSCFWISVSLCKAKINNVNYILFLSMTYQKVVGFHVSVDKMVIVQKLKSLNHLVGNHQSCLDCEFALAEIESVF